MSEYDEYVQGWIDRYKAAYAAVHGQDEAIHLQVKYNRGWFKIGVGGTWDKNVRVKELAELCQNLEQRGVEKQVDTLDMNEYQRLAMRTAMTTDGGKPAPEYLALSLTGEAGEIAELVKKAVYHGHRLNRNRVADELGDVLWYVAVIADRYGWSLSDVAERNIVKLERRYPNGFSEEASRNRDPVTENLLHGDHEGIPEKGRFRTAGKLGSWTRRGMLGERYLDIGGQGTPYYCRIVDAKLPDDGTWRYVLVQVEGSDRYSRHGCGMNVYEKLE